MPSPMVSKQESVDKDPIFNNTLEQQAGVADQSGEVQNKPTSLKRAFKRRALSKVKKNSKHYIQNINFISYKRKF